MHRTVRFILEINAATLSGQLFANNIFTGAREGRKGAPPQVKPIKLTRPELEPEFEPSRGLFDIPICEKLIIVLPCSFHLSMNAVCKAFDSNIVSEVFRQTSMFLLSVTIPKTKMMSILLNTD